jgi:hypothetical protein
LLEAWARLSIVPFCEKTPFITNRMLADTGFHLAPHRRDGESRLWLIKTQWAGSQQEFIVLSAILDFSPTQLPSEF